jgi:integrase
LAKHALTDAVLQRKKPPTKGQTGTPVPGFPGLSWRSSQGGTRAWCFLYRFNGKTQRWTFGIYPAMSLAEAHEMWGRARNELAAGRDPKLSLTQKKPALDFPSVAEEWLQRDQAEYRTAKESRRIIDRYVLPAWAGLQIDQIGRREVLDLTDSIKDRGTPTQALRVHARLHRLFHWAVARGILKVNPMTGMDKPAKEVKRDRVLTDEELTAVWRGTEQLGWPFGDAIRLLILTGARREEIGQLRRTEIVGDAIALTGDRTKNGEPHDIPLSKQAVELLKNVPRIAASDFVFTTTGRTSISGWSNAKEQLDELASIPAWRLHDIRRSVATGLQKLGIPLQVTEAVLGHVSGSRAGVVGIYQRHGYADEKRVALNAWGAKVMALIEGRESGKVLPMRDRRLKNSGA